MNTKPNGTLSKKKVDVLTAVLTAAVIAILVLLSAAGVVASFKLFVNVLKL